MKARYWVPAILLAVFWFGYYHQPVLGPAPPLTAKAVMGQAVDLQAMQGKPVLVNFWATSCPACVRKIPEMEKLYQKYSRDQFEIIAVSVSYDPPQKVVRFLQKNNIPWPVVLDYDDSVARSFGEVSLIPASFLISPDGDIVQHDIGEQDFDQIDQKISALL
ncbi:MAG: TlpA family protein disulfide reductase [gamma proteobacterium symbiont of Bathyaustriella thionipta]|nr:TlpA family protein disulfide reductase [gamma proteobacterium symbiont of Bathyaustriella thionipta]